MDEMRAALYDRYGPPEVLYEGRLPVPSPERDEVLVRVHATSVNGVELHVRSGRPRLPAGRRFPKRVGIDFAGEIVRTGAGVRGFGEGDRIWGILPRGRFGSAAEYVAVRPRQFSLAPRNLALVEAASLPAGTTAITALRDKARLKPGERLLVRGAAGGVGSVAVQFGRALGAHVTALAGAANLDFVRGLGADEAFDYRTTRPADLAPFDVVMDTAGTEQSHYRGLLTRGGRMVAIAFDTRNIPSGAFAVLASAVHGTRRIRFFSGDPDQGLFADLAARVENGDIRHVVDTVHSLSDIAAAHRALEVGGVRGKHVVRIG
ncbi:NAD(P)-dependent alcohol dehydrogenase [Marinactinospora endophytica]